MLGRAFALLWGSLGALLAPRGFPGLQYVAVSQRTRDELIELGVAPGAIAVIHNGIDVGDFRPAPEAGATIRAESVSYTHLTLPTTYSV